MFIKLVLNLWSCRGQLIVSEQSVSEQLTEKLESSLESWFVESRSGGDLRCEEIGGAVGWGDQRAETEVISETWLLFVGRTGTA
jgi:hypothetical protein